MDGSFLLTFIGFGLALIFFNMTALLVTRYKRCGPDEILVIYGRVAGGMASRCIHGGGTLVWPGIQDYKKMSLLPMSIEIPLDNAVSVDDIEINIKSNFTVGISTEPQMMQNAAEHLLNLTSDQIQSLACDIIVGQLRQIFASLTLEQISSQSVHLDELIQGKVGIELGNVGIKIIAFHIDDVTESSISTGTVTEEKLNHYLGLTKRAREKATPIPVQGSPEHDQLTVLLRMADDYASDAKHFMDNGDYVRAFGAINYAHAWIDAGVKLRLLDGHGDDDLFTLP